MSIVYAYSVLLHTAIVYQHTVYQHIVHQHIVYQHIVYQHIVYGAPIVARDRFHVSRSALPRITKPSRVGDAVIFAGFGVHPLDVQDACAASGGVVHSTCLFEGGSYRMRKVYG
jgi:hypothetical protein